MSAKIESATSKSNIKGENMHLKKKANSCMEDVVILLSWLQLRRMPPLWDSSREHPGFALVWPRQVNGLKEHFHSNSIQIALQYKSYSPIHLITVRPDSDFSIIHYSYSLHSLQGLFRTLWIADSRDWISNHRPSGQWTTCLIPWAKAVLV